MLLPWQVRRKLAALGRGEALPARPTKRHEPELADRPQVLWVPPAEQMPPGREMETKLGPLLSHRLELACAGDWAPGVTERSLRKLAMVWQGLLDRPHSFCMLDIETAGLSGQVLFLVGLLHIGAHGVHIHQFLARDYSEEPAVLAETARLLDEAELWVSYNGRTFDVPYIEDRLRYHRLPPLRPVGRHLDLLIEARRELKAALPDCKLQTLEEQLFHRGRLGDVPGEQIPEAYREFVLTGETRQLAVVMQHNQLDVIALLEAAAELLPRVEQREE